jgi:hypothetical protein
MRIVFKVFARITGGVAARAGRGLFESLWEQVDEHEPPKPTNLDVSLPKVVAAATLEAATMAAVAAVVERATAVAFSHLFGVSPEPKKKQKPDD